jgi:uncharacterized protein (DUF1501 family)
MSKQQHDRTQLTRRGFLTGVGGLGAAVLLGSCSDEATTGATTSTTATTLVRRPRADGTLVLITLYGGNDALNTVIPITDPLYARLRSTMAIDAAEALAIDDRFALHPSLARTKELWDTERLAIVHGVGFEGLDRSHFHCMDVWQAGGTDDLLTGWVGRWLDHEGASPLDALGVGGGMPLLLRGSTRSGAVVQPQPIALPGDARLRGLVETLVTPDDGRSRLATTVAGTSGDLLAVIDAVAPILVGDEVASSAESPSLNYSANPLTDQLQAVAKLMTADLPTRVYSVGMDGFDTHANQLATQASLLRQLDTALGAFFDAVGDADVTVAVYSEFGRRVRPNSSGTDHGAGGTVLLAGNVRAGHHGDPPPLDRLDDGDLTFTTDFRSVFGGLLEGVVGTAAADLVGDRHRPLALV